MDVVHPAPPAAAEDVEAPSRGQASTSVQDAGVADKQVAGATAARGADPGDDDRPSGSAPLGSGDHRRPKSWWQAALWHNSDAVSTAKFEAWAAPAGEEEAMVFNGLSVTPQVFRNFYAEDDGRGPDEAVVSRSSSGELVQELRALRHGRVQLQWTLCNPFRDGRLLGSLFLLAIHTVAVVFILACVTAAACLWTSHAATPRDQPPVALGGEAFPPPSCGSAHRSGRELKSLLLSIDIPFFICVATAYCFAMANMVLPSKRRCSVVLTGTVGAVLALVGSVVVALGEPHQIWGSKGSVGFAGIWIALESVFGIGTLVLGLSSGPPSQRLVRSKVSAVRFGLVLLGSALALQGMYYLVEMLSKSGMHAAVGLFLLFGATFLVMTSIKQSMRQWGRVPPLACTFMLYWFQAGAYMSFRIYLQTEEMVALVVTTLAAALSEFAIRVGIAVTAKLIYNYYVRRKNAAMALRVLDVHIATVLVDILAEWAAIAIAGVLGGAVDSSTFDGLRTPGTTGALLASIGLQVGVEIAADVASLVAAFAILPVSLEGIFSAPGHRLLEMSCAFASLIFVFSTLNMRIQIDCFSR